MECKGCKKPPEEIKSVVIDAKLEGMKPEEFIKECEGTYNKNTGKFWCTDCYFEAGMPLGKA